MSKTYLSYGQEWLPDDHAYFISDVVAGHIGGHRSLRAGTAWVDRCMGVAGPT